MRLKGDLPRYNRSHGAFNPIAEVFHVGNAIRLPIEASEIPNKPPYQAEKKDDEREPGQWAGDKIVHNELLANHLRRFGCPKQDPRKELLFVPTR